MPCTPCGENAPVSAEDRLKGALVRITIAGRGDIAGTISRYDPMRDYWILKVGDLGETGIAETDLKPWMPYAEQLESYLASGVPTLRFHATVLSLYRKCTCHCKGPGDLVDSGCGVRTALAATGDIRSHISELTSCECEERGCVCLP